VPTLFQCDSCHVYDFTQLMNTLLQYGDVIKFTTIHRKLLQGSKKITTKLYKRRETKRVIRRSRGLSSGCEESNSDGNTRVRHSYYGVISAHLLLRTARSARCAFCQFKKPPPCAFFCQVLAHQRVVVSPTTCAVCECAFCQLKSSHYAHFFCVVTA